ncbi:MAG TPA: PilZ domain-containing protein [Bacillota bacterium]|nr:PilZ domain-containing protein [Bacillota bacterium]
MLVGFVERRLARRIPFKVELTIHFERNGQHTAIATATDISAGGIRFYVPWGTDVAQPGETAEFVFDLPNLGQTRILGEIRHLRFGIDLDQNRIVYYGARFLNLPIEIWNHLVDFCQTVEEEEEQDQEPNPPEPLTVEKERQDFRIATADAPIEIHSPNGEKTDGHLEDISFGGLKSRLSGQTPLNTEVTMIIPDDQHSVEVQAICIWAIPLNPPEVGCRAGFRFVNVSKEQFERLRAFVFKLASQTEP